MQKIDGCIVNTAMPVEDIKENIIENGYTKHKEITESGYWRDNTAIAIVGGGPSLKNTVRELDKYPVVMACGSVHDYLIHNYIYPNYCVVCDPDEIVIKYLTARNTITTYLLASQCAPKVFEHLADNKKYVWHAGGEVLDPKIFGKDKVIIGGGCTVGTRAIHLAIGMGFNNIHLYGFDTCLDPDLKHHAYSFVDAEKETIGNIYQISLGGPEGKKFHVAGYMLGQLFDFQDLLKNYGRATKFTVHGDGLLKELMKLAELRTKELSQNGY